MSAVIWFNKMCTTYRLTPKFINIIISMIVLVGAYLTWAEEFYIHCSVHHNILLK